MQNQAISMFSEKMEKQIADTVISIVKQTVQETLQNPQKRYFKKNEFCKEMGISYNTLDLWIRKYNLKVVQVEGISMIDYFDAVSFLEEHKK